MEVESIQVDNAWMSSERREEEMIESFEPGVWGMKVSIK